MQPRREGRERERDTAAETEGAGGRTNDWTQYGGSNRMRGDKERILQSKGSGCDKGKTNKQANIEAERLKGRVDGCKPRTQTDVRVRGDHNGVLRVRLRGG